MVMVLNIDSELQSSNAMCSFGNQLILRSLTFEKRNTLQILYNTLCAYEVELALKSSLI